MQIVKCSGCGRIEKKRFGIILPNGWDRDYYTHEPGELHTVCPNCCWSIRHNAMKMKYGDCLPDDSDRAHAYWIANKKGGATCSHCKRSFMDVYDIENYDYYCRHCGAVMEGIKSK